MKVAIIGASGKTGLILVREALARGHQVVAVCRVSSAARLKEFSDNEACTVMTAGIVSDVPTLTKALSGCDAVVAILLSVRDLKATELVKSLAQAAIVNGVTRFVFTAGEVTVVPEPDEDFTVRQKIMLRAFSALSLFTPFSMSDMIKSSVLIRHQPGWDWTIVRAPTLSETPKAGYRLCEIHDVTAQHALSREDYAACMLDSLDTPDHYRRILTVLSA